MYRPRRSAHRVVSSLTEGVAAREAAQSEPDTARRSVALYRLHHVFRARRFEPAGGGQEWRDPSFIETQGGNDQVPHLRISLSISAWTASNGALAALRRGLITMSQFGPAAESARRTASRTRRRMRLRTTDFPIARGTVKPTRGPGARSGPVFSRQNAMNRGPVNREPPSYTRRKSPRRKIREDLENEKSGTKNSGLTLHELGVANVALVADGQLPAALGAAAGNDGATVD